MSPKELTPVSQTSAETPTSGNLIDQIEAKFFYRPEEDDGQATVAVQRRVDQCRIQARGGIKALLAGTPFGQFLVRTILDDPLLQERERRADQIEHYARMLELSGILPSTELAEQYARSYYEVLPDSTPIIIIQAQLQGLLENALEPFFQISNFDLIAKSYEHIKKVYQEVSRECRPGTKLISNTFSEIGISEEEGDQLLFREFVWKIKIQLAHLLSRQEDFRALEMLAALNTLSNNKRMDLWAYLPLEMSHLCKELSGNPKQRKVLTDFSLRRMVFTGLNSFEEFSAFLQKIGVQRLEGEELTGLLDYKYLDRNLDFAWKRDKKNYFQVIEFLLETEILTPSYLNSDKMLHRSIEYYLVSFYDGDYNDLRKDILPYLLRLGIFPNKPADPRQNDQLLNQYDQLCARLKLDKDIIIQQNYARIKKPDKYLQGVDKD